MIPFKQKILELEKELNLETFTYKGVGVWPVIRLSILLNRPKTNNVKSSISKKLRFLAVGLLEFFKWKLGLWPKSKNVFLSSSHYKVKENGIWYDRIIDPFLSWLDSKGEDYIVFDFTNSFSYEKLNYSKRRIRVQPVIYLLSFLWKMQFLISRDKKKLKGNVDLFNKLTSRKNLNFKIDTNFYRRLYLLEKQSLFFEKLLKEMSASHVGLVCYYDTKSLALTWASNRLGIPVIDFQHGVQGPEHFSYSHWPKNIIQNSLFIPSHFYVWDEFSFNNIAQWHNENNIINGGNKWILDRVSFSERNIILYTVQPLEDPIPSPLIEAIKNYSGNNQIYIRLHPQQLVEYSRIENLLKRNDIYQKVNIEDATFKPLTDILAKTAIHLTKSSSVAIEASYFNIPTIFLSEVGESRYKPQLAPHHLYFANESNKILDYLYSLQDVPVTQQKTNSLHLDDFEKIRTFYDHLEEYQK